VPFDPAVPRPFTSAGVFQHAPASPGVYGITNAAEWIYIGTSENLQDTLMRHIGEQGTPIAAHRPSGFVFETCSPAQLSTRLARLVLEYEPVCNGKPRSRR
jgi:excinuclease UvrABC nuclease subunit